MKKFCIYILVLSLFLILPFSTEADDKQACPQCGHLSMSESVTNISVYFYNGDSHYFHKTLHQTCSHCTYDATVTSDPLSGSHQKSNITTEGSYYEVYPDCHRKVTQTFYDCTYGNYGCHHRFPGTPRYGSYTPHTFRPAKVKRNGKYVMVIKCVCGEEY